MKKKLAELADRIGAWHRSMDQIEELCICLIAVYSIAFIVCRALQAMLSWG